ncbi:MAG: lpxK [Gammaproteobacteria bacterium]|jgi:tetraacyldisaccharide 4'-kinase|nr:lpxK [Gammaproteobacteria bacterium]
MKPKHQGWQRQIVHSWYNIDIKLFALLIPFSFIFRFIIVCRRLAYRFALLKTYRFPVPVIVVGNISVGGTGKTPCVIALVEYLRSKGFKPGIISRGYKGKLNHKPYEVQKNSLPEEVGDEAVLLKNRCNCPVMIGKKRKDSVKKLLETTDCDIVISDDGLQHYALGRDIEIVMMDGIKRFGNGYCLPAGPLREPVSRLQYSDFLVVTDNNKWIADNACGVSGIHSFNMTLTSTICYRLQDPTCQKPLKGFIANPIHAVAGIGHPERFFDTLIKNNLQIIPHPFPDHHFFQRNDFAAFREELIFLTEKDAVKCTPFNLPNAWVLPISGVIDPPFFEAFLARIGRQKICGRIEQG